MALYNMKICKINIFWKVWWLLLHILFHPIVCRQQQEKICLVTHPHFHAFPLFFIFIYFPSEIYWAIYFFLQSFLDSGLLEDLENTPQSIFRYKCRRAVLTRSIVKGNFSILYFVKISTIFYRPYTLQRYISR